MISDKHVQDSVDAWNSWEIAAVLGTLYSFVVDKTDVLVGTSGSLVTPVLNRGS